MTEIPNFPLFKKLYTECGSNPNKYKFTNHIRMKISTIHDVKIIENIYYIIHHYHALETYSKYKDWNNVLKQIEPQVSSRVKKSLVYLTEYGGKSYNNGNGISYNPDDYLPPFLKLMIAAYIMMLSE